MITNSPVPIPKPPSASASSAHVRFVVRCSGSGPRRRVRILGREGWRVAAGIVTYGGGARPVIQRLIEPSRYRIRS